jgi:O-Antigen ligase
MTKLLCRVLCVLLFVAWTEESRPLMYEGHWKSPLQVMNPLVTSLPGVHLSPWQLFLLALWPLCVFSRGRGFRRSLPLDVAGFVGLASIMVTLIWGLVRGGSAYQAYFQLNPLVTALLFGVLLFSVVGSSGDLRALGLTVLAAALTRGALVFYFYYALVRGRMDPPPAYMTCHEDSLLFVAAILVVLSWAIARRTWTAWISVGLVSTFLLWAVVLNARRIAWIEVILVVSFAYLLLPRGALRRRWNLSLTFLTPVLLLYVLIGWGRQEPYFEPLRALSTAGSNEDLSSLARLEEMRNLIFTLSRGGNPLLGRGWGQEYLKMTSVYANFDNTWSQYRYQPHNSLLGVAAFGGFVGLFGMWLAVPVTALLGTRGYHTAKRPVVRAAGMAAVCILPAFAAQCYGDIGLQQISCTLFLGMAMGVAAKLSVWGEASISMAARGRTQAEPRAPLPSATPAGGRVATPW